MANVVFNNYNPTATQGTAEALVSFRPHNDYHGEFGFDWVRLGDTGKGGDKYWYKDIMGYMKYGKDPKGYIDYCDEKFIQKTSCYENLVTKEYKDLTIAWKTKNGNKPFKYIIPYLSLMPNYSAKLKVIVEIKEAPDKFEYRYNSKYFYVEELATLPLTVGVKHINAAIKINCIANFERDQYIEVYAIKNQEETLAGRILVVANSLKNQRNLKVCFVNVKIGNVEAKIDLNKEIEYLRKYFRQAYINIKLRNEFIEIDSAIDLYKKINDYMAEPKEKAQHFLESKLYHQNKDNYLKYKYNQYYLVFFIPFMFKSNSCGSEGYLLGLAEEIPTEKLEHKKPRLMIFDIKETNKQLKTSPSSDIFTVTHEICHAIGLSHTFDNGSSYVFEQYKTDNIMDYYSTREGVKKTQLYKWQWDILQKYLD